MLDKQTLFSWIYEATDNVYHSFSFKYLQQINMANVSAWDNPVEMYSRIDKHNQLDILTFDNMYKNIVSFILNIVFRENDKFIWPFLEYRLYFSVAFSKLTILLLF